MEYERSVRSNSKLKFEATTEDVIDDFVNHTTFNSTNGVESQVLNLVTLFGRLADHLGVDILELVEPHELEYSYIAKSDSD